MLPLLLTYYHKAVIRYFRRDTTAKSITVFLFLLIAGALALLIYKGFYVGFSYLLKDSFFGEALSLYVTELFLLVSFVLVFASALISGVISLFRAHDGPVLLASPQYAIKPWLVFARMFFTSLWPLLIVIIPALIAITKVFTLSWLGFGVALSASTVLVCIAVLSAMLMLLTTARLLYALNMFARRKLLLLNAVAFVALLGVIWVKFHSVNLANFFQARILDRSVPDLTPILNQFDIFPSHLVAMTIYNAPNETISSSILSFGYLFLIMIVLFVLFHYSTPMYLRYWQVAQEGLGSTKHTRYFRTLLLARAKNAREALLIKECLLFVRNPRGMLWLGFILLIWGIQSASSFLLVRGLGVDRVVESSVPLIAGTFQIALVSYFMSMFALRFAFPSFSEEQKTAWVIASAPLSLPRVFTAKLYFFTISFCLFAGVFTVLNTSIVGFNDTTPLLLSMVLVSVVTITTFALALGAIFPNSETSDPEVLSTTLPGLSFITLALLYGGGSAFAFRAFTVNDDIYPVALFTVCSFVATILLINLAQKSLSRRYIA